MPSFRGILGQVYHQRRLPMAGTCGEEYQVTAMESPEPAVNPVVAGWHAANAALRFMRLLRVIPCLPEGIAQRELVALFRLRECHELADGVVEHFRGRPPFGSKGTVYDLAAQVDHVPRRRFVA